MKYKERKWERKGRRKGKKLRKKKKKGENKPEKIICQIPKMCFSDPFGLVMIAVTTKRFVDPFDLICRDKSHPPPCNRISSIYLGIDSQG